MEHCAHCPKLSRLRQVLCHDLWIIKDKMHIYGCGRISWHCPFKLTFFPFLLFGPLFSHEASLLHNNLVTLFFFLTKTASSKLLSSPILKCYQNHIEKEEGGGKTDHGGKSIPKGLGKKYWFRNGRKFDYFC